MTLKRQLLLRANRQSEEQTEPRLQFVELDRFARRDEIRLHVLGEAVAREHDQAWNRPRLDVLNRGRNFLFGSPEDALVFALHTKGLSGLRMNQDDVNLADSAPNSAGNADLLPGLEAEFAAELRNSFD